MSSGSYFPPPVRAVEIPKGNDRTRKRLLGIPTVADRVAQAVVRNYLEAQVEPCFHPDSYAYRPSRSALDAIAAVRGRCWKYDWVLEFDIKGAFDHVDHELMMKAVRQHARCTWVELYVERWLKAPMMRGQEMVSRTQGTPQGGVVSPVLFNLYMHYAFDTWMARHFPDTSFVRYADDGLVHCKNEAEAIRLQEAIGARLKACGLELHPEKTRIVYCRDGNRKNDYPTTSFDFLGYTFRGRLAKSKRGVYFNSFSPALSGKAAKRIREKMRTWNIGRWTEAGIDGTLIQAWAGHKSFVRRDDDDQANGDGGNFKGEKRSNDTHESKTDVDARLYRKGGTASELRYMGHTLSDNRHGLVANAVVTIADGYAEREAARVMINDARQALDDPAREVTLGADKGYDAQDFVQACVDMKVTPHVAQNKSGRHSAVPEAIAQSVGYAISQQKRKLIEQGFGWAKTVGSMRQVMVRGLKKVDQMFVLTMAAYNLVRMRTLGQIRAQEAQ